jgi:hypothetical protein
MEEALAPQAHDIAPHRERGGDLLIRATFGGEQDHFGAENFAIWQRILTRPVFQHNSLMPGQPDSKGTVSGHFWRSSFDARIAKKPKSGNNTSP